MEKYLYIIVPAGANAIVYDRVEMVKQFLHGESYADWNVVTFDGKREVVQSGKDWLAGYRRVELLATIEAVEREHKARLAKLHEELAALQ